MELNFYKIHYNGLNIFSIKQVNQLNYCKSIVVQTVVNKELKLIETDQNKIKSQFESLKKLVLPHLSIVEKTYKKHLFFFAFTE